MLQIGDARKLRASCHTEKTTGVAEKQAEKQKHRHVLAQVSIGVSKCVGVF